MSDLLHAGAARFGGNVAVEHGDRRCSYAGLRDLAGDCAAGLAARGVRRGDRIAVLLPRGIEAAATLFGTLLAGAVAVPVAETLRRPQVAEILADARVRLVIGNDRLAGLVPPDVALVRFAEITGTGRGDGTGRPVIGGDLAMLLYTSGSTGGPKGVMVTHDNLLAGTEIVTEYLRLRADDRVLSVLPWSFDYGLNQLLSGYRAGATVVIGQSALAPLLCRQLADRRITVLAGVPPLWAMLTTRSPFLRTELPHLRLVTNSGGTFPPRTVRAIRRAHPHVDVVPMYGLTEAFRSTYLSPELVDRHPTSIGRPVPGTECLVLREDGSECDVEEVGQLVHRGPTVATGYWNRPEETAAVFRPHPHAPPGAVPETVVYSGDFVRRDAAGLLYYVGRRDEQFKSRGTRVNPGQIEDALVDTGLVTHAVVFGQPDGAGNTDVVAVVVLRPEASTTDLAAACRRELPPPWVPTRVVTRDELPRTASGKTDRRAVRAAVEQLTPA